MNSSTNQNPHQGFIVLTNVILLSQVDQLGKTIILKCYHDVLTDVGSTFHFTFSSNWALQIDRLTVNVQGRKLQSFQHMTRGQ